MLELACPEDPVGVTILVAVVEIEHGAWPVALYADRASPYTPESILQRVLTVLNIAPLDRTAAVNGRHGEMLPPEEAQKLHPIKLDLFEAMAKAVAAIKIFPGLTRLQPQTMAQNESCGAGYPPFRTAPSHPNIAAYPCL